MKNWPILLLIALVAILIVILLTKPVSPAPDLKPYQDSIKSKYKQIDSLLLLQELLKLERYNDSVEYSKRIKKNEIQIAGLKKKIAEIDLTHATAPELDSIRNELFTEASDTLYSMPINQARRLTETALREPIVLDMLEVERNTVSTMAAQITRMSERFQREREASEQKYQAQRAISGNYKVMSEVLQEDNKKLRKGTKLLKVAVPLAFLVGLVVGL